MGLLPLILEKKESFPLIEFTFGAMSVYVTTSRSPVSWQGKKFIPEPALEVKLPKQGVTLEEEPCVVTMPTKQSLHPGIQTLSRILSEPRSAPKMIVRVMNLLKATEEEQKILYLYEGTLTQRRRNPKGKPSTLELEFLPELVINLEDITLGRRADPECDWIFGEIGCYVAGKDLPFPSGSWYKLVRFAYVIPTFNPYLNSREVTLDMHLPSHPGYGDNIAITSQPKDWWLSAFLTDGYLKIPIQEWRWNSLTDSGTNIFILNRVPPSSWTEPGVILKLVPDCPKTAQACKDRQAENRFGGLGFGIPPYNPTTDVRDG